MRTSRSNKKTVIITMGDPSGIGPEVTLKALASGRVKALANFLLIGDRGVLDSLKKRLRLRHVDVPLIDMANVLHRDFSYGVSRPLYGKASIEYIDEALRLLKRGKAQALVTGPINKASVNCAGYPHFQGHTEYLAASTSAKDYAMMLVGEKLKVTLVTRHIALKEVAGALSKDAICKTILITDKYLKRYYKIRSPRIGVAGLNPHSGDDGLFGEEERLVVIPAVKEAARRCKGLSGPVAPDSIFYAALNGKFDAVVALYHDQGLIPFKMLYFRSGVNLTLGLPFVRTSPDHGTAFDIAGRGLADPTSMIEAIRLACSLASKNR